MKILSSILIASVLAMGVLAVMSAQQAYAGHVVTADSVGSGTTGLSFTDDGTITDLDDATVTFGESVTITAGGLTVTAGGVTITAGGLDMTDDPITNIGNIGTDFLANGGLTLANALTVTTGGLTVTAGGAAITGDTTITDGTPSLILVDTGLGDNTDDSAIDANGGTISFDADRDDGAEMTLSDAGLLTVTNGVTVTAGGLTVTAGGATITAGGLDMTDDPITNIGNIGTDFLANGGLTLANALTVTTGGATITAGGLTVSGTVTLDAGEIGEAELAADAIPFGQSSTTADANSGGTLTLSLADNRAGANHDLIIMSTIQITEASGDNDPVTLSLTKTVGTEAGTIIPAATYPFFLALGTQDSFTAVWTVTGAGDGVDVNATIDFTVTNGGFDPADTLDNWVLVGFALPS